MHFRMVVSLLCCMLVMVSCHRSKGMIEEGGELALGLDQVLGISQVDVKAAYQLAAKRASVKSARLALLAGLDGGVRGELRIGARTYLAEFAQRGAWQELVRTLFGAHKKADAVGSDRAEIAKLCGSKDLLRRTAGQSLLAKADQRAYDALFGELGPETPPTKVRQLTAVLLSTKGRLATVHLIELSQRYPELLEELLGAVAEREEDVAVAYLTAVAAGHDEVSARQTARAALELRQQ